MHECAADERRRRPSATRGHRTVCGARRDRVGVWPHDVDVQFRGLGRHRLPDRQRSRQVHVIHAHAVGAGEYAVERQLNAAVGLRVPRIIFKGKWI